MNDKFQATDSCPIVANERKRRQHAAEINEILMRDHNETVREMAILMDRDPSNFTAFDAAQYMDTIWARYFE